jgi:hypothetical protein
MVDDIKIISQNLGREISQDEIMEDIVEDMKEDQMEENIDIDSEIRKESYVPEEEQSNDVVPFIERVINRDDKISSSFLTENELGRPTLSVRFWRQTAQLFDKNGLYDMPLVQRYLISKAKINEATSLSREGKVIDLAVTTKKIRERKASSEVSKFLDSISNKQ